MDAILPFLRERPARRRALDQSTMHMIDNQMCVQRDVCEIVGDTIVVWGTIEVCESPLRLQE